jgi:rubrerythrin
MIPALIIAILAIFATLWVVAPIRRSSTHDADPASEHVREAIARKDAAVIAMVDIENEHELGKLSDADFAALRAEYESEAITALRALESVEVDETDDQLEAEIAAMKERLGGVTSAATCPNCGAERTPGRACPSCGSTR